MLSAGPELLPEAEARHERTLEAVSSRPLLGAGSGRSRAFPSQPSGAGTPLRLWCVVRAPPSRLGTTALPPLSSCIA